MWDLYVSIVKTRTYLVTMYFVMGMVAYALVSNFIKNLKKNR